MTSYEYDGRGRKIYIAYKDGAGRPILGPDATGKQQCAIWAALFNEGGTMLKATCQTTLNGAPVTDRKLPLSDRAS